MNILAGRAIVVAALGAAEVVDGLSREGFGGKSGAGDNDLAVFIAISGVCGLVAGHADGFLVKEGFCSLNRINGVCKTNDLHAGDRYGLLLTSMVQVLPASSERVSL